MNKEYLKYLYKQFSHFENPDVIKQKIDEYIHNSEINKYKNVIKNYKIRKKELENQIIDITNRLKMAQLIEDTTNTNDYNIIHDVLLYYNPKLLNELKQSANELDKEYELSKRILKEYYYNIKGRCFI